MHRPQTLCLLHTGPMLLPVFTELANEIMPGVKLFHMLDESLIKNTIAAGKLEKATIRRLWKEIECARDGGADVVMVTCSSLGPAIAPARQVFDFPVLRVDQAMAEEAVRRGRRVGVLATLPTTLAPTCDLVRDTARTIGRECEVITGLCAGAFEAVSAGQGAEHDRLVTQGLAVLMEQVDIVVLAQASMARVIQQIPPDQLKVPVLSSPRPGMHQAQQTLATLAGLPSHENPPPRPRFSGWPRADHLPRPDLFLGRAKPDHGGSEARSGAIRVGTRRFHSRLWIVSNPARRDGRPPRSAPDGRFDCVVVVGFHNADRVRRRATSSGSGFA